MKTSRLARRGALVAALAALGAIALPAAAQTAAPVRIGSTLALTGPLSATAQIHKIVGEIYVEQRTLRADELAPFNQAELAKWAELVKRSGAQVD